MVRHRTDAPDATVLEHRLQPRDELALLDAERAGDLEHEVQLEAPALDQRLPEAHQHQVHAVRLELHRLAGRDVQHRDLAHARDAVEDLGAVDLHPGRDGRGDLQQPVGLPAVVLEREVGDAHGHAGRRRARPGVGDGERGAPGGQGGGERCGGEPGGCPAVHAAFFPRASTRLR